MDYLERIAHFKGEYLMAKGKNDELLRQREMKTKEKEELEKRNEELSLEREILNEASQKARENGRQILSDTCSHSIQSVLEQDARVDIDFGTLGGQSTAELLIEKTGNDGKKVVVNPAEDDGGGIGDLVALSTFLSFGMLCAEDNMAPLFLDEPTKFVSKGYSQNVSTFIKEMVDYVGKQTFIVTHDETVAASGDRVYRIAMDENLESVVTIES